MTLKRFIGGVGIYFLGIFLLVMSFILYIYSTFAGFSGDVCYVIVMLFFVGFFVILAGLYNAKISFRSVPHRVELLEEDKLSMEKIRRCPMCGRIIPFDSIICPYCKFDFKSKIENKEDEVDPKRLKSGKFCSECGSMFETKDRFCRNCGNKRGE